MHNFNARIKKLKAAIENLPSKFRITFNDGNIKIVDAGEAIKICCYDKNAVRVEETGEAATGRFAEILQELIETDEEGKK